MDRGRKREEREERKEGGSGREGKKKEGKRRDKGGEAEFGENVPRREERRNLVRMFPAACVNGDAILGQRSGTGAPNHENGVPRYTYHIQPNLTFQCHFVLEL